MRQLNIFLSLLLSLSIAAEGTTVSWKSERNGCSVAEGYIDFNTASCWDSGMTPSSGDSVIISTQSNLFGISISSNITVSQLTINGSLVMISTDGHNIASITITNRGKLFYNATRSSSSITATDRATLMPLLNQLMLNQLSISDATLDLSIHSTFDIFCPSIVIQDGGLNINTPTFSKPLLTWHFDSMILNGGITETSGVSHVYHAISNATIITSPSSLSRPLALWNPQSSITFNAIDFIIRSPVTMLANAVKFSSSSSLMMESTSIRSSFIDASSTQTMTLSSVVVNVNDVNSDDNDHVLISANSLTITNKTYLIPRTTGSDDDLSCSRRSSLSVHSGKLVLTVPKDIPYIEDLKIARESNEIRASFTPVVSRCVCVRWTFYTIRDNMNGSQHIDSVFGSDRVSVPLAGVSVGWHEYSINFTLYDQSGGSYKGFSNRFKFYRDTSSVVTSYAAVLNVCISWVILSLVIVL
ncbi:hypothetical protein PROFUN_06808 [Planoprotostelium fungivorum]|uniref:Uncharacterized protein n=1 Tax=Planoprotostelium fungivorum TaxID=1890364 RepID=A0A2P6NNA4_9EUKA|nr:hypothetical protein PROFUN_06808 [Planoprotostelium fungivorum]